MADKKKNQPPTGQGKKQSPVKGQSQKIEKRSTVAQASNARQNLGTLEDEMSQRENPSRTKNNPKRPKAGR
ncbi:MAG TPA: hypothetical protein VKA70_10975 [Blastocatellia bacterium]|nr:hypothetical protein [Blastocatellia bacterium]